MAGNQSVAGGVAPQTDETALIRRSQRGDTEAFAALVQAHQGAAYRLALRLLSDPEEATDIAQEAFIRVWRALPSFRGQSRFSTWLYRIVYNLSLNRLDSLRRQAPRVTDGEAAAERLPAREGDPARAAEANELRTWLWRQVDSLPERYRAVLVLYYQQDLSYDEIAEVLDLPLGTVKTHLFRGKAALKEHLQRQWPGTPATGTPLDPRPDVVEPAQVHVDQPATLHWSAMRWVWAP